MNKQVISDELFRIFGKKPITLKNKVKIHIEKMDGAEMVLVSKMYFMQGIKDINLKRSGGGITITIKNNSSERV